MKFFFKRFGTWSSILRDVEKRTTLIERDPLRSTEQYSSESTGTSFRVHCSLVPEDVCRYTHLLKPSSRRSEVHWCRDQLTNWRWITLWDSVLVSGYDEALRTGSLWHTLLFTINETQQCKTPLDVRRHVFIIWVDREDVKSYVGRSTRQTE